MSTISIGSTNVLSAFKGTTAIKSVYRGAVKLLDFFSPLSLFANGEQGVWYEPSATTAFRSTTDLTPCDYGQSAGFLLDLSQGAGYSSGFTGLGSALVPSGFSSATNGSYVVADGNVTLTGATTATNNSVTLTGITGTSGTSYLIEITINSTTGDSISFQRVSGANFGALTSGSFSWVDVSNGSASLIRMIEWFGTLTAVDFDFSVRELPGNHATQATAAARPILARVPEGGRRNLLERTEEFGTSPWTGTASVTANSDTAPDGAVTADTLTDAGGVVAKQQTVSLATSTNYVASVYLKKTTSAPSFPMVLIYSGVGSGEASVIVNTDAGSAVARTGVTQAATGISVVSDGDFWRVSFTFSFASLGAGSNFSIYPAANTDASSVWESGTTGSCVVWGAQLEAASSATAYQRVSSEYDITEAGVTSLEYLAFDGSDDFMLHTVNVETAIAAAVSVSSSQTGYRGIFASGSVGSGSMLLSRGATSPYGTFAGATYYPSGTVLTSSPNVVVMEGTSSGTFYTDGVSDGTYSATSGQPTKHIGGESAQRSSINLFSLIALDRAFGSDRINTENYLATKSGVTL